MTVRPARWTTAALVMLCAGLGAVVAFELTGGLRFAPEVTAAPPPAPGLDWSHESLEFAQPSRDLLEEIEARPLFSPSRRPFVAAQEEAMPTPIGALPSLELIGVLLTERQRAALMQPVGGGEPSWVREGSDVRGWRVEKIERSRVHLRSDDRLDTVELRADTAVAPDTRLKWRGGNAADVAQGASDDADKEVESDEAEADPTDEADADPTEETN
jgi:hypothetical protein